MQKRIQLLQEVPHYFGTYFLSAVLVSGGIASSASSKKLLQTETHHSEFSSKHFEMNVNLIPDFTVNHQ